jgi:hypothetical protein
MMFLACSFFSLQSLCQTHRISGSVGVGHILSIFPDFPETNGAIGLQLDWLTSHHGFNDEYAYRKPE